MSAHLVGVHVADESRSKHAPRHPRAHFPSHIQEDLNQTLKQVSRVCQHVEKRRQVATQYTYIFTSQDY